VKTKTLILSDLHLDTWTDAALFVDFLRAKGPTTKALYINGDLLDMPPARDMDVCPPGSPVDQAMAALIAFAGQPDTRLVYVVGNHDIGISGLRINYGFQLPWLGGIAVTYPRVHIPTPTGGIVVEHGHFYDPSLALYAGDLMLGTYFGEARTAKAAEIAAGLIRKMQRRNPVTAEPVARPGDLTPPAAPPTGCRGIGRNIVNAILKRTGPVFDTFTPELWRQAAKTAVDDYNKTAAPDKRASTIVFGHTHMADAFTWDTGEKYFNDGSWTHDNRDYLELDEHGVITRHTWK
jgi:UDP-2,3-diacylglucosamine pyrophosphatase LpxH